MISADRNKEVLISAVNNCNDILEVVSKPTLKIKNTLKFPISPEFIYNKGIED
jgi:hypothetical protein